MRQVEAEEVAGATGAIAPPLGERPVRGLVQHPCEQLRRAQGAEAFLGCAYQQGARAAAQPLGVHIDVEVRLSGLGAVVHQADLGRADELTVRLGQQGLVVGVGVRVPPVVGDGLGGDDEEGEGQAPDVGEALGVWPAVLAQLANDQGHGLARYAGTTGGGLRFSGGAGRALRAGRPVRDNHSVTLKIVIEAGGAPYEQVRAQIAEQARSGELPVGYRLPTVRGLAESLGLAANTVAKAYRALESDGVIETRGATERSSPQRARPRNGRRRRRRRRTPSAFGGSG
uniref:HTH gntR-type domain-containing protein n=1 Tax=Streptomyces avermitilis TaxID=33903 RepID=A0A499VKD5_STRAX|nr:hypothetical protein SAVMC3_74530 [Streptomyces avermitilis]